MFDDQQVQQPDQKKTTPEAGKLSNLDIVVRSMPKEFHNRAAKVREDERVLPTPAPKPIPQPQVIAPAPKPQVVAPQPRKKSKALLAVVIIGGVLLVTTGSAAYYTYSVGMWQLPGAVQPVPVTEPMPVSEPVVPEPVPDQPTPEPARPISGADTDSDGLTNVEELQYGTDFRNPDTDGDTFLDGNEVYHRYDPLGLAPSTLFDTGSVRVLQSVDLPFTIYYPTTWNPVSTPASQRVSFRSTTGAAVNVLWQDKAEEVTLADWYESQVGDVRPGRLQSTQTKEGYAALIGPDERTMYLDVGTRVFTLVYDLGDATSIEFLQTFKMMANSFTLFP